MRSVFDHSKVVFDGAHRRFIWTGSRSDLVNTNDEESCRKAVFHTRDERLFTDNKRINTEHEEVMQRDSVPYS